MLSYHSAPATPPPCDSTDSDGIPEPKDEDAAWNPFSAMPDTSPLFRRSRGPFPPEPQVDQTTSAILESLHKLRIDTAMARERGLVHSFKRKEEEKTKGKNITLFKTEMCTSFTTIGHCRYGNKCKFAHGPEEIRNIARHPKYKTQLCRSFFEGRPCPYGKRCCYLHHSASDYIGYELPELSPLIPEPVHQLPILTYSTKAPSFQPFQPVNFNSARRQHNI